MRSLDEFAWRVDVPQMVMAGAIASVVALGMFLSAAGIFSLMSVSVARKTREIGLRAALGASRGRLLRGIFSRAVVLSAAALSRGTSSSFCSSAWKRRSRSPTSSTLSLVTSVVMLTVGLLACVEPARRALRIHPTEALKEA